VSFPRWSRILMMLSRLIFPLFSSFLDGFQPGIFSASFCSTSLLLWLSITPGTGLV